MNESVSSAILDYTQAVVAISCVYYNYTLHKAVNGGVWKNGYGLFMLAFGLFFIKKVIAGSFDLITPGHLCIADKGIDSIALPALVLLMFGIRQRVVGKSHLPPNKLKELRELTIKMFGGEE
jgi:hypothetical protein